VLAIQQQLDHRGHAPARNRSRTVAALAAAVVAAVALAGLLFGPLRNHATLFSPFASASEKSIKNVPASKPEPSSGSVAPADPVPEPDDPPKETAAAVAPGSAPPAAVPPATNVATAPATPPPSPAAATAKPPSPPPARSGAHSGSVHTTAPSWIWACADGKTLAGRVLPAGSALDIEFSRQAQVLIGNAGAVDMALDGKSLGPLGPEGRARVVELTPGGFHLLTAASQECGDN
jgi:cytoskeleton protein RodZ